jgi:Flp pilus assembly protein TadD
MDNTQLLYSATQAFRNGNPLLAEQIALRQLQAGVDSDFESWMILLGLAVQSQDKHEQAIEVYAELTRRFPGSGKHWGNLGTALREAKRNEEAEAAYCQAIVLEPTNAMHFLNVGLLLSETGNHRSARVAFLQALDVDPGLVQARIHGAFACFQCGDHRNAQKLLSEREDWRTATDLELEDRLVLSNALMLLSQSRDAEQVLLDALAMAGPEDKPVFQTRLVAVYERMNRLDEAHRIAAELPDPSTVADPKLAQDIANAHASLAHRGNDLGSAKGMLEELARQPETELQQEAALMFSLAKVCDKQGDTDEAMRSLVKAHAAQIQHATAANGMTIDPDVDPLQPLRLALSASQFASWPPDEPNSDESGSSPAMDPVFVVGFPRSGTTMLEQMLDATPGLRSMDERDFLNAMVDRMQDDGFVYPDQLGDLDGAYRTQLRSLYWSKVEKVVTLAPGDRLVDKNPLSMLLLPMIRRMFPASPIILALRHPCDVVLSCYMQHFRAPVFVSICASLERLSRSYVNAMQFWIEHERLLKPKVMHLRYEDMLADFDAHARRIGDFIGIEDVSAMHDFHGHAQRKGFIATPSYEQVIKPLNNTAVGRWRKYERYFQDALPILQPMIEHWGYAD